MYKKKNRSLSFWYWDSLKKSTVVVCVQTPRKYNQTSKPSSKKKRKGFDIDKNKNTDNVKWKTQFEDRVLIEIVMLNYFNNILDYLKKIICILYEGCSKSNRTATLLFTFFHLRTRFYKNQISELVLYIQWKNQYNMFKNNNSVQLTNDKGYATRRTLKVK
jgi:hypothetical protein